MGRGLQGYSGGVGWGERENRELASNILILRGVAATATRS